jgi:phenylpyruvate tautomerase PptA (4-oxalocrotonate tautomerase family)
MPQYRCLVQQGRLDTAKKTELAREITRIHCELTGAPKHFVHVIFQDHPAGDWFTAGERSSFSIVNASIRAGRSDAQKRNLMELISREWSRITGQSEREVVVTVTDIAPQHWMEAGQLMPQPGEEKQWFARLGLKS